MRAFHYSIFAASLLLTSGSAAQAETTSKSCAALEFRQFDFWIGSWDVFDPAGKIAGVSRVERINEGCALLESWQGSTGVSGKSLNAYDATEQQWHQFWVDSTAERLVLKGSFAGGKMVLAATLSDHKKAGALLRQKITWSQNADGSVRQHWETSSDGRIWSTAFDGKYVRRLSRK